MGLVVDHSTTSWTGHHSVDESVDGTPRQRTWDYAVDGFRHVAKVRVASSNLVIRSQTKGLVRPHFDGVGPGLLHASPSLRFKLCEIW